MSRWKKLIGLGEKAVDEAQALRNTPAPLTPNDVADYLKTVKDTGQTHRAGGAPAAQPNIEMAKKHAVDNRSNFGAGTGGLSGLAKYGLIGTIATASLAWVGNAITGDDPKDSADDNLTHIQRVQYKFGKAFSDEGQKQIDLAIAATTENSKRNTAEAKREAISSNLEKESLEASVNRSDELAAEARQNEAGGIKLQQIRESGRQMTKKVGEADFQRSIVDLTDPDGPFKEFKGQSTALMGLFKSSTTPETLEKAIRSKFPRADNDDVQAVRELAFK